MNAPPRVTGDHPVVTYKTRAAEHIVCRDEHRARSRLIATMRLTALVLAIGCVVWRMNGGPSWLGLAAFAFAGAFGALIIWHSRVDTRAEWHEASRIVNERALARVERRWDDLPAADVPADIDLTDHPYALDLDLFGRASLFQWMNTPSSSTGRTQLASWLLAGEAPDIVRARQEAVAELAPMDDWREQFATHGLLARGAGKREVDAFIAWAGDEKGTLISPAVRFVVYAVALTTWITGALWIAKVISAQVFVIPMVIGLLLTSVFSKKMHAAFKRAGAGEGAIGRFAPIFAHATHRTFTSPLLRTIRDRLTVDGVTAADSMRSLTRILGCADLARNSALIYIPIQAITLWDFHVMFALDKWRRASGPRIRDWLDAVGHLEAVSALAWVRHDNPDWCTPEIDVEPVVAAEGLGHPLIAASQRVVNDVTLGPPGTVLLITGSNMSGKSTLLRAIGLNVVLAQAGASVCATRLRLCASDLETSIRIQDSLELGMSYFMAAISRLKGVVDAAQRPREGRRLLYLLDEVLQGTNSAERSIAVRAVADHLLRAGAIGAMSTHDLALVGEEPLKSSARFVHFTDTVGDDGVMRFDFRLREGPATSSNALRLMRMIGIEVEMGRQR